MEIKISLVMCRSQKATMAIQSYLLLSLIFLVTVNVGHGHDTAYLSRKSFPKGFVFGSATSAYQVEGAANTSGRGPSVWDTFAHTPGKIFGGTNGDVAVDEYHRYKEDVAIMKNLGFDAYRFSISWSRILPNGKLSGGVNKEGIAYYNNLTNELLANGLKPYVTLFHWDVPQALEDEFGGFLSPKIVKHFRDFAEVCFKNFGDRVKHWITLNEPWSFSYGGYAQGALAPGRCSKFEAMNCTAGDSSTEPYLVSHHEILAHAAAVKVYKSKYQALQKGIIGITLVSYWIVPYSNAKHNINAAIRALDFQFGWYMDPLTYGDYPHSMRSIVGSRLPKFTAEEKELIKGSYDFIGINYYTSQYATYLRPSNIENPSYLTDSLANLTTERNGVSIGPQAFPGWLYIYPEGLKNLLIYTKKKYNNPIIYITENGIYELDNTTIPLAERLIDNYRIDYYKDHLKAVREAISYGVRVKGYFAWSLLDNFEWASGYLLRFGINYVDYQDGLKRYPKLSAGWFKKFLKKW